MYRIKGLGIMFILFSLIVIVGCNAKSDTGQDQDTQPQGGEIKVAYPAQPPVLDPHVSNVIATTDIMSHVYETLLTVDSNYSVQPMLAESYEQSEDGQMVTFKLREGVLFHNGEEMVADDVVASMKRWKDSVGARGQFNEATFEAQDDYTVTLTLPKPMSTVFVTMSYIGAGFPAIMPKEVIDRANDTGVEEYIGTGPYQFEEWQQDQQVHLTKFEDYQSREEPASGFAGEKEAVVDDLFFVFTPDTSTQVAGIQSGEYDIAFGVPYDVGDQMQNEANLENTSFPNAYMAIHFNKRNGLFTDVKARQAIAAALDMESIMIAPFANDSYYSLSHNLMMSHQKGQWDSEVGEDQYNVVDIEKATQLLNEAGYNGEEITFITTRDYEEQYNAAVVIQEQLERIGMNIKLEIYDWPSLSAKREDDTAYDMFMMGNVPVPEPTSNVYLMSDYSGWTDSPELDNIIEEFREQPSVEEAKPVYDKLQEWFWDYMPIVKVGDYDKIVTLQNTIENFKEQNENHRLILWNVSNNK
ncbi:ABC transporter substrate-binding protein [Ornithinibacillus sp. 4-3]|uniref:ABC transporter substrate-binding protein n=1 Tax=Ornithinibacillus sp. 4-3 TaxID=3231488 RepID=A0AB39HTW9_9BACI